MQRNLNFMKFVTTVVLWLTIKIVMRQSYRLVVYAGTTPTGRRRIIMAKARLKGLSILSLAAVLSCSMPSVDSIAYASVQEGNSG